MRFVCRRICRISFYSFNQCRSVSVKQLVKSYGIPFGVYYWITNEVLVLILTYCLYYDYFGRDLLFRAVDRLSIYLEKLPFGKVNLHEIGDHSWRFFDGRLQVDPKLVGDFTVASVVMSLLTPVQIPICAATFPWLKRRWSLFFKRSTKGS